MWEYRGQRRPEFADPPAPGQESVWDYPRPPTLERDERLVEVRAGDALLARTRAAHRVLETASPPGVYVPQSDVDFSLLTPADGQSLCEWKGLARYWRLASDARGIPVAWSYDNPNPTFERLRGCLSFYPGRVACTVDGEPVRPQAGQFYGGWITSDVAGPFKGAPGTEHW